VELAGYAENVGFVLVLKLVVEPVRRTKIDYTKSFAVKFETVPKCGEYTVGIHSLAKCPDDSLPLFLGFGLCITNERQCRFRENGQLGIELFRIDFRKAAVLKQ